jgi:hypothetical protein
MFLFKQENGDQGAGLVSKLSPGANELKLLLHNCVYCNDKKHLTIYYVHHLS